MYKLEDRILFDGAAVADVTDAQQEAEAQQEAAQQAEAEEASSQQDSTEQSDSSDNSQTEASDSLTDVLAEIGAASLGSDGQRIDVLLVSDSLENADDICNTADANTIVVRYDARTTSAADLMQQITDALGGHVADSIGFVTESGENAHVQLFADADTSLDTVNDAVHQDFFNSLDTLLDDNGQVNLFASNLASTAEGEALVDAIGDSMTHDVAASTDETGSEAAGGDWDLEYSTNGIEIDAADVYLDQNLVDNFDSLLEDHVSNEIVFINSSIMDVDEVLAQLGDNVEVVELEAGGDGLRQITDYLNEHSDVKYDVVHILTHGNDGYFNLSNSHVDSDLVAENAADLVQWRNALSDDADIHIYGCNLAESAEGKDLLAQIASATGADVAASTDMVKNNDWSLEYNVGDINYGSLDVVNYNHNLVDYMVTTIEDVDFSSKITLREAIELINAEGDGGGGTISFDTLTNLGGTTIRLSSDVGYRDLTVTGNVTINGQISIGDGQYVYVNITRAAATADTNELEADRDELANYTANLDTDIEAIQAAIDAYDGSITSARAMYDAINAALGYAYYTYDYAGQVEADGEQLVSTAESDAAASGNQDAIDDAADARAAQDLIDDSTSGYNTIIEENWNDAVASWNSGSFNRNTITAAQAQAFVAWFTNMSANSQTMYSADASDPTDTIITETNNVAVITDTNPDDHYRLITVIEGGNLTLINSTLFGGYSDSAVTGDIAAGRGGAIYISEDSSATLINVDVTNNSRADSSIFTGNRSSDEGGGIYNAGSLSIYEDESLWADPDDPTQSVSNNIAGTSGGAIYSTGTLSIEGPGVNELVQIRNNTASDGSGGAIYSEGSITLMENVNIYGNTATEHGGGAFITSISDPLTLKTVVFENNSADGSGGGLAYVDSPGDLKIIQSDFEYNHAAVNGGAIYMENTGDFTYLGTVYVSDEYQYCYENSIIRGNYVSSGEGGGFYLSKVGNVILNSVDFDSNGSFASSSTSGGGAIKMLDSGNLSIIDSIYKYNFFWNGNGSAIDYDGGTNGDKTLSITTSYLGFNGIYYNEYSKTYYIAGNNGGAIYQAAGDLNIVNSTFQLNHVTSDGAAIWADSSIDISIDSVTFADNSAGISGGSIFVANSTLDGSISIQNTIISDYLYSSNAQIVLPETFDIKTSKYNIFSHYYNYGIGAQGLADGSVSSGTNYEDANHNYVGTATGGSAYILSNIYLSQTAVYTANYKTYTLALTSEDSIAYRSGNTSLTYDQRGNTRKVDPYGNSITTSRGAFEPIFNLVVTTTADDTTMLRADPAGYYANLAWADGITLREAVYWVDSGNGVNYGVVSFNDGTYSGHNFYAEGADNTITLNGYQITIGQYRRSYSSDKNMTINGVAASQDAANRVIVDAGNLSRVFCVMDGTTKINHLTLQNGTAPAPASGVEVLGTDTYGGAIYNYLSSTLILNNVVVQNSTATAVDYRGAGYGGGIYNSGTLYLYDTTITGNQAIAVSDSNHVWTNGGQGGGIYNAGILSIYRSTIDNNSTIGNQYVTESAKGAGIFNKETSYLKYTSTGWEIVYTDPQLLVENSTIAYNNNMPSSSIATGGEGSAIYFTDGSILSIINSTIANNYTTSNNTGADWTLMSGVYIDKNSSFTLNLNITNSILADNYVNQLDSSVVYGHWNDFYITSTTGVTASTTYNVVGFFNYDVYDFRLYSNNYVGAYLTDVDNPERGHVQDLFLNPTLDYRGGRTKVLSLLEGSLLLDLTNNHGTDVSLAPITDYMTGATLISNPDQRGNTRSSGEYSIGSYQPIFAITVDVTTDSAGTNHGWNWTDNTPGWVSDNTVRDAIYWIDPTGTITFGAAVQGQTITLNSELGQLLIEKSMTIVGGAAVIQASTAAGTAASRIMYLSNPTHLNTTISVTLQNMTLQYGVASVGGGIYNTSNLTLQGVTVQYNNASSGSGGGIYSLGGSLTIGTYTGTTTVYSNISNNTASSHGGGIYYEGQSTLNITQTNILNNQSTGGSGGGIYVTGANFTLTASTVGENIAKINGGGINSMSTDITMVNSTIANNTTGELGGGIAYFVSGTLDMNFVTIANNISGTTTTTTSQFGGGLYMAAGTFNMANSVIAQNYRTSVSSNNRDDFYVGATISTGTVSYNVFGKTENFTIPVSNNIELGVTNPWTDLALDTELTDNGGPTLTLYVFNTDVVLQNGAEPGSGATVTTDQRGIPRPATGQPTIGAYQKNITNWVYIGDANATLAELNDASNWVGVYGTTGSIGTVGAPDQTLYFDPTLSTGTDNVVITETWNVSYKASVVVDNGGHLTVEDTSAATDPITFTAGLSVINGGTFTVGSNAAFAAANNTNVTLTGSSSSIVVNNTFSGTVNVTGGTLKLNTTNANLVNLTLGTLDITSTVEYGYTEAQTVRAGTYGNLTISGGGVKTANGIITVEGATGLTVESSDFVLAGNLESTNITLDNGNINGGAYNITSTGDTTATGASSISGGVLEFNTLSSYNGDISGSTITVDGDANITGDIASAGDLTFKGTTTLADGTAVAGGTLTAADIELNSYDLTANAIVLNGNLATTAGVSAASIKVNSVNSDSITMDFTGANRITVNDYSTLTLNTNSSNITLNTVAGSTANTFKADNITVTSTGTLEFKTTGDITLDNVDGTVADGIKGNLILRGYDITLNGASFNYATLTLANTGNLNIDSGGFTSVNSVIFDGVVNIVGDGATIESTTGNLTFNKNVIGNGHDFNIKALSGNVTVKNVVNSGDLTITVGGIASIGNVTGTGLTVTGGTGTELSGIINVTGPVFFGNTVSVAAGETASVTGSTLNFGGDIIGAGDLTLAATGDTVNNFTVDMTGNLTLSDGEFVANGDMQTGNLNIASPASLDLNSNTLTVGSLTNPASLTNAGTLSGVSTANIYGNVSNSSSADMSITNLNLIGTTASTLSLDGTANIGSLTVGSVLNPDKQVNLVSGNIAVTNFEFSGSNSGSKFILGSGTSLEVTGTLEYNADDNYYDGNYFVTSGGGTLIQTLVGGGGSAKYRVGNNDYMALITLTSTAAASEKIGIGILDSVKVAGEVVTGIEETDGFTLIINRDTTAEILVDMNWDSNWNGLDFNQGDTTDLFVFTDAWTSVKTIAVVTGSERSTTSFTLDHNSSYTIANSNADLTVPPLPMNVNIYEMANAHYIPMYPDLETNIFLNFPVGFYPYYVSDRYLLPSNLQSVGEAAYRQMELRWISNPQTNMLDGQVPAPGVVLGQGITEQASLTLTADAPIYLEVNGEYSVGQGWAPLTEPATVENIEQYQEPVTQGQIDQFYLDFSDREDIFDKPLSFKSDLDEMLDNLLAG